MLGPKDLKEKDLILIQEEKLNDQNLKDRNLLKRQDSNLSDLAEELKDISPA